RRLAAAAQLDELQVRDPVLLEGKQLIGVPLVAEVLPGWKRRLLAGRQRITERDVVMDRRTRECGGRGNEQRPANRCDDDQDPRLCSHHPKQVSRIVTRETRMSTSRCGGAAPAAPADRARHTRAPAATRSASRARASA